MRSSRGIFDRMKDHLFIFAVVFLIMAGVAFAADDICTTKLSCEGQAPALIAVNKSTSEPNSICIYFFYGQGCPHCANVEPLIKQLGVNYPEVELKSFEIYFNNESQKLFNDFNTRYGIERPGIPAVFIGDRALIGEKAIKDNLESSIVYFKKNGPICPETHQKVEATPHEVSPTTDIKLTLPAIISAALIDSINPCAFAVLIFLLVYLSALGARRRILKVGFTYIIAIFIVYFLSGLGLFQIIQTTGLTRIVYVVAAAIAIVAGLINVKDFFWYGKGITLAIPESKKPLIQKYVQQATIPAAVVLGFLVSMFELPCTGGVYLAILGLLSSKMSLAAGVPYLLLYNVIFVLPLFVILFLIYKGLPAERAEKWRLEKRKWMKLAIGVLMIALGVIMLLGWI
jgi:cytochrome c biogenesis protein CcdA/glutaredoxin